jgi:PEP-CTERM motif
MFARVANWEWGTLGRIALKLNTAAAGLVIAASLGFASTANATITLTFVGLQDQEPILNYYNGGLGGFGSGPGPNFGILFEADSPAAISEDNGGTGDFNGAPFDTVAFFEGGPGDVMNVASGFTTGLSFYYASPSAPGSVTVWSGLDGSGTQLANVTLPTTPAGGAGCDTDFCPWVPFGVTFFGKAESIDFSGGTGEIGFSAITLGTVPEPSTWAMMVVGFAFLGFAGYRAKRKRIALVVA